MNSSLRHTLAAFAALTALGLCGASAMAQDRDHRDGRRDPEPVRGHAPGLQLDHRYRLDHYYPARGYAVPALPAGSLRIAHRGGDWFFHAGVWFRPAGGRYIVGMPPFGIAVPLLPAAYATVLIGGLSYYYANGVYYMAAPGGYTVVAPPPAADQAQPLPQPVPTASPPPLPPPQATAPDPIIYPRNGQQPAQTEADRQECNRWATTQPNAVADASVFQRAVAACMDGRGYTLR